MKKIKNAIYLIKYAWKKCRFLLIIKTIRSIFSAFLPLINVVGLGVIVNTLTTNQSQNYIFQTVLLYIFLNLSIALLTELLTWLDNNATRKASDITQLDHMYDAVFINYHYAQDGSILDLRKKSMKAHPVWFLNDIGGLLKYIVQFAGIIYIFARISPFIIIIIIATSVVYIVLSFKAQEIEFEFQNVRVPEDRQLDYLYNIMSSYEFSKEIRINQADSFIEDKYRKILSNQAKTARHFSNQNIVIGITQATITVIQTLSIYLYFSYQVFFSEMSIADYTILLGATTLFVSILLGFFGNLAKTKKTLDYADLFRRYREHIENNSNISISSGLQVSNMNHDKICVEFKNVTFTYPGHKYPILKNINLKISSNEKIGIVGLNGSGKTTLIKLLCRLYDPEKGQILFNGVDIKTIPYDEYTKTIGIVLQDFFLFAYSIQENIVFDYNYDEKKLIKSIHQSGLNEKISSLRNGINTSIYKILDSEGIEFSGGEGQKLALARVIYKDTGLLVLDEPTSAMDPISEYEFFSNLAILSDQKATVFISHRLSSTVFCDKIFVICSGNIIETGTHYELMQKNGFYANLFREQAKYYKNEESVE